jgi:hypothetical protein
VKRPPEDIRTEMIRAARRRAQKKGIPFCLDKEDIRVPERCPVLGLLLTRKHGHGRGPGDASPTLDRIDPSKGYTADNVIVMSHRANRIKSDVSSSDLIAVAQWMMSHGL